MTRLSTQAGQRATTLLVALLLPFVCGSLLGQTTRRAEPFRGCTVELAFPSGWTYTESRNPQNGVQTIELADAANELLLDLSFLPDSEGRMASRTSLEALMRQTFQSYYLEGAVEKTMKVNFFDTPSGPGAWASFTDRSLVGRPIPEGQKLISTTGLRSWKGAFLMFTLLSNSVETSSFRQAMNVVQAGITLATTPTSTPDAASLAGAGSGGARRDAVVVSELPTEFKVTVPVSRLVMHIPKGRLHPAKSPLESGSTVSRRYFMLSDQEGLVVSGWFEPQEEFPGLEKYWDQKMAVWSGLPKPQRVSFGKTGKWNTVTWFVPSPAGSSANISAHWVEAGTWIDVHLSILSKAPEAEAVAKLALLLAQIEVAANSQ